MSTFIRQKKGGTLVSCPYESSHRVASSQFLIHLSQCEKNYPGWNKCPYNAAHRFRTRQDLEKHLFDCRDARRGIVEKNESDVVEQLKSLGLKNPAEEPTINPPTSCARDQSGWNDSDDEDELTAKKKAAVTNALQDPELIIQDAIENRKTRYNQLAYQRMNQEQRRRYQDIIHKNAKGGGPKYEDLNDVPPPSASLNNLDSSAFDASYIDDSINLTSDDNVREAALEQAHGSHVGVQSRSEKTKPPNRQPKTKTRMAIDLTGNQESKAKPQMVSNSAPEVAQSGLSWAQRAAKSK